MNMDTKHDNLKKIVTLIILYIKKKKKKAEKNKSTALFKKGKRKVNSVISHAVTFCTQRHCSP